MLNKGTLIAMFLSLPLVSQVYAEDLSSSLTCQIKKQIIFEMKNGEPVTFSGFNGGLEDGDKFNILLDATETKANVSLKNVDKNITLKIGNDHALEKDLPFSNVDAGVAKMVILRPDIIHMIDHDTDLTINKSYFSVETSQFDLVLERYHRDDWSGTVNIPQSNFIIGVDCTMDGKYNEIVERIREACLASSECKKGYDLLKDINI